MKCVCRQIDSASGASRQCFGANGDRDYLTMSVSGFQCILFVFSVIKLSASLLWLCFHRGRIWSATAQKLLYDQNAW
jgi:hypothetical protein